MKIRDIVFLFFHKKQHISLSEISLIFREKEKENYFKCGLVL